MPHDKKITGEEIQTTKDILRYVWDLAPGHPLTDSEDATYFRFYQDLLFDNDVAECLLARSENPIEEVISIVHLIQNHWKQRSRIGQIKESFRKTYPWLLDDKDVLAVLKFAIKLWLFMSPELNDDLTLEQAVQQCLPTVSRSQFQPYGLPKDFSVQNLRRKAGFKFVATHNLTEHLKLERRVRTVQVFGLDRVLNRYAETDKSSLYPPDFLTEVLRTLELLFPPSDPQSQRRTRRYGKQYDADLEALAVVQDKFDLSTYPVFGMRLKEIQEYCDQRRNLAQWWSDRRRILVGAQKQSPETEQHEPLRENIDGGSVLMTHQMTEDNRGMQGTMSRGRMLSMEGRSSVGNDHYGPPTDSGYASATKTNNDPKQGPSAMTPDDSRTVYSDASSIINSNQEHYLSELAHDLYKRVLSEENDDDLVEQVCAVLPELLKGFALKIGHNAPTQMYRDIMVFVHKRRDTIFKYFVDQCHQKEETPSEDWAKDAERMPLEDLMESWLTGLSYVEESEEPFDISLANYDETMWDERGDEDVLSELAVYREAIIKTPAYEWLIASLQRECLLSKSPPYSMDTIKQTIISALPTSRYISRRAIAETYTVTFEIDWDPLAFIKQQAYKESPERAIEVAITLTGLPSNCQALPVVQYLCQTWPLMGEQIMGLVKSVLCNSPGTRHNYVFPDQTLVAVWNQDSNFVVEVSGTADSIAEVGQQFVWLGAALRSSTRNNGIVCCTPYVSDIITAKSIHLSPEVPMIQDIRFKIDFTMEEGVDGHFNGHCWYGLFRNPVVVQGYPIRRRTAPALGLEIPLSVIAGLTRSRYVNVMNSTFFVKSFSTLLWTTRHIGDMLIWHLVYNEDGEHISYYDTRVSVSSQLKELNFPAAARHIVGWCSDAKYCAGASTANYAIQKSGLPKPRQGCMLEKVSISAGKIITGGLTFAIGVKDVPVRVSREGYIPKLKWLSKHFVVLWDEDTKRGWLVNGTSALLHLLRASLEHSSSDKFKSAFLFKREEMHEASDLYSADSAVEVLLNPTNKALKIYPEKDGFLSFEDQVEKLYDSLDKMIDHQVGLSGQNGVNLKMRARKHLEGWDFKDVATDRDPFYPHVTAIPAMGKGWIDFTRTIHAITLFGRGFGDIIQPTSSGDLCPHWARLPPKRYYLAACVSDLKEIMENDGDPNSDPMKLCDDIVWHHPDKTFETCQCAADTEEGTRRKYCDRAQVLLPTAFKNIFPKRKSIQLNDRGAVIFGHNVKFFWFFPDNGGPQRGEPPEEAESQFHDSGVGSSLTSSATNGTLDAANTLSSSSLNETSQNMIGSTPQQGAATPEGIGSVGIAQQAASSREDGDLIPSDTRQASSEVRNQRQPWWDSLRDFVDRRKGRAKCQTGPSGRLLPRTPS